MLLLLIHVARGLAIVVLLGLMSLILSLVLLRLALSELSLEGEDSLAFGFHFGGDLLLKLDLSVCWE
jgi:hypothetical protein